MGHYREESLEPKSRQKKYTRTYIGSKKLKLKERKALQTMVSETSRTRGEGGEKTIPMIKRNKTSSISTKRKKAPTKSVPQRRKITNTHKLRKKSEGPRKRQKVYDGLEAITLDFLNN